MEAGNGDRSGYFRRINRQRITSENCWLLKAVEQKNPRLTVALAYSEILIYDRVDRILSASGLKN